ncbi:MAG: hypothetical protein DRP68_03460 [Candidatus Omnitrophota bacterium]|nr:MAG: hypothetical protein DRP68_03460 [Candidatus Omnitrophota bacterium]RKY38530.1 MAG: hypothetical protein DRP72_01600 [Candidatus Omnitrophota bacterium]RKY46372.1 MAG: hypothetical protein DRP81_00665 [Candidatus Omnitrophota bacterium]
MRGLCGLGIEKNVLKFLLVSYNRNNFFPLYQGEIPSSSTGLVEIIRECIDSLEEILRREEKKHSLGIERIYLRLPINLATVKIVEDIIPLSSFGKKIITHKVIDSVKQYIENANLELNHFCIHHIILEYRVGGKTYLDLPLSLESHKIDVKSYIVYTERKMLTQLKEIFENVGRKLSRVVFAPIGDLSVEFGKKDHSSLLVTVNIEEEDTLISLLVENKIDFSISRFGREALIKEIERNFAFSPQVSSEILNCYLSFSNSSFSKEIVIKKGEEKYMNVSLESINSTIKKVMIERLMQLLSFLEDFPSKSKKVLFLGNVSSLKGFYEFIQESFPTMEIVIPQFRLPNLALLGVIKYGIRRFLEEVNYPGQSVWNRLLQLYREYF